MCQEHWTGASWQLKEVLARTQHHGYSSHCSWCNCLRTVRLFAPVAGLRIYRRAGSLRSARPSDCHPCSDRATASDMVGDDISLQRSLKVYTYANLRSQPVLLTVHAEHGCYRLFARADHAIDNDLVIHRSACAQQFPSVTYPLAFRPIMCDCKRSGAAGSE